MSRRTIDARQGDAARTWRVDGRRPITPQQVGVPTVSERTGEGRLMLAVLEDAIASFWRYYRARAGRSRRLFHRERAWFATDDVSEPFAFATICDTLGLDRAWLRRMLPSRSSRPRPPNHRATTSGRSNRYARSAWNSPSDAVKGLSTYAAQ